MKKIKNSQKKKCPPKKLFITRDAFAFFFQFFFSLPLSLALFLSSLVSSLWQTTTTTTKTTPEISPQDSSYVQASFFVKKISPTHLFTLLYFRSQNMSPSAKTLFFFPLLLLLL